MNFPFYFARRYLFSKKSTNVINLISAISMIGVAVATMALVIVLSVFNGFHDLVASFFTAFDPQIEVVPTLGKTAPADDELLVKLKQLDEVDVVTENVEEQALAVYRDRQAMVTVKGVQDNFSELTHINDILYGEGEFSLEAANLEYGTMGIRLAQEMGTGSYFPGYMKIFAPMREGQLDLSDPASGFVVDSLISPGVVFAVRQAKYDKSYIITSIAFARRLFGLQGEISSLEIRLKNGSNIDDVKEKMRDIVGDKFQVLDRYEQQADTFKIMQIEKFIAYIFLTFILMVACFNIIGSLSMLIIDKKDDVMTLRNLGATDHQITQIFLFEGRLISAIGAIVGIVLGLLLCWIQQTFGVVALGESSGAFVVDAYPVSVHYSDVIIVFFTVLAIGWLAVWYPVRYLSRRLLSPQSEDLSC
ncbi:MAG: ABC transporter permease [Prevotella sp.]|nr:ABC transporter permease [Prevotella sp.]